MKPAIKALIFIFLNLIGIARVYSQNPFEISLTGINTDSLQKGIVALDDGGFITKEVIKIQNSNYYKILISRLDPCLGIKWSKTITSKNFIYKDPTGFSPYYIPATSKIMKANDSGFLLVFTDFDSSEDCIVIKISNTGNQVWARKIHTGNADISNNDFSNLVSLTCTGVNGRGYAIAGLNNYSGSFIVRLREDGKTEWSKYYYYGFKQMSRILAFSDSSFMLLYPGDESQIMKLDASGNIIWAREDNDYYKLNYYSDFDVNDAIVDKKDFVYATGNYNNLYPGLMKMDKNGNQIWEYSYKSLSYLSNNCLTMALTKGNKIVLSNTGIFSDGSKTTFIETDTNGYIVSAKTVPDIKLNAFDNTVQISDLILDAMADSGFVFIGTDSIGGSLIVKADKNGSIGCNSQDISIDTAFHISTYETIKVSASEGYWVSDTSISFSNVRNKASLICSSYYYPVVNLGPNQIVCSGSTDTINAGFFNLGFKYLWSTGDTTFSIVARKTGTYWVRVVHNFCTSTDTVNIVFKSQLKTGIANLYPVCPYDSVFLQPKYASIANLYWVLPGKKDTVFGGNIWAKDTGEYYLKIQGNTTCPLIDSFYLTHYSLPKAYAGPNTLICHEQPYMMKGSGGIHYLWKPAYYLSSDTIANPILTIGDAQTYQLMVTDAHSCHDTSTVTIRTRPVLQVKCSASDTIVCYGQNDSFYAKGHGGDSLHLQYSWPYDGLIGDTVAGKVFSSGWHKVILSDNCTPIPASDSFFVRVVPQAKAIFDYSPASPVQINRPIHFQNNSTNSSSYLWSFGTGDKSNMTSPEYNFKDSAEYKITLIAFGLYGCPNDTDSTFIKIVNEIVSIYVPNAFSPDGNHVNDFFNISGIGIESYSYSIYNRWGEEVFYSSTDVSPLGGQGNISSSWDGTFRGKPVPAGVYQYQVNLIDISGNHRYFSGTITLIR